MNNNSFKINLFWESLLKKLVGEYIFFYVENGNKDILGMTYYFLGG